MGVGARARADRADAISRRALRLGRETVLRAMVVELSRVFAAAAYDV